MKSSPLYTIIGFVLVFAGCSANHALPKEVVLFPDARAEKWWIINSIFQDENDKDVHLGVLISLTPNDGRCFTHFITSLWTETDSVYYIGSQSSEEPFYQKKHKFPIKLAISAKDSASLRWYWKFGRKSMRLQSVVQQETERMGWPLQIMVKMAQDSTFNVLETRGETTLYHLPPALTEMHLSGAWQMTAPAILQCHVIDSGKNLMEKTKHSFISWLDISLSQGMYLSLLYETDLQGNIQVLSQTFWQEMQVVDTGLPLLIAHKDTIWQGNRPGTAFPLRLSIALPEKKFDILIRPRIKAPETSRRKNSLWIGPVQATDAVTDTILGNGNLYMLKQ